MFYSLTGKLVHEDANTVAISCNGIAFQCLVSMNTLKAISGQTGEVTLYTYLNVKQDGVDLMGFHSKDELQTFKLLISVSGVGPKAALAILSELEPAQLAMAIASGDHKTIQRAQGVGPKAAQRVVLELKDKMAKEFSSETLADTFQAASKPGIVGNTGAAEAVSALVALGYSQSEASIAVGKVDPTLPTERIITQALKQLL